MKKKKIKKGIILLSMVMIIINTILPTVSNAANYTRGNVLYTITNGNENELKEAYQYIYENANKIKDMEDSFITIQSEEGSETINAKEGVIYNNTGNIRIKFSSSTYPYMKINKISNTEINCEYYESSGTPIKIPYKITVYEIITPTPTPPPTPDGRVTNLLNETGNGVGTILTWVGDLWKGITTGDMSAILPVFIIFIAIPLILLVIKIIRKSIWGD